MRVRRSISDWLWGARVEKLDSLARLTSIGLGVWLVFSAFHWRDSSQMASTIITGAVIVTCAAVAWLGVPWARIVNSAAAVWLFFSSIVLPYQLRITPVNQMLVALVVLVCSFLPLWSVTEDEGVVLPPLRHA
jgi:hypothetical protein